MTDAVRIPCAMSGEREVLTVYPVGKGGVSFCYGGDASVIVDGDALLKVRAIIDQQIAPPPPANIGADSPSVDGAHTDWLATKRAVVEAMEGGVRFWQTCSGCHESNEGHPTGPYSKVLQCHVGFGCFECGGIGAIWQDYGTEEEFQRFYADDEAPEEPALIATPAEGGSDG